MGVVILGVDIYTLGDLHMNELFKKYLDLSAVLRPQYPISLGHSADDWEKVFAKFTNDIPSIFRAIYSNVSGTMRDIEQQELMDFIPGYRLIHICELADSKNDVERIVKSCGIKNTNTVIPLLANYSSDFICYANFNACKNGGIYSFAHDEGEFILMCESAEKFMNTILAFYQNGVYFLDSDGYLDYDMEKESTIGAELNHGVAYWNG